MYYFTIYLSSYANNETILIYLIACEQETGMNSTILPGWLPQVDCYNGTPGHFKARAVIGDIQSS